MGGRKGEERGEGRGGEGRKREGRGGRGQGEGEEDENEITCKGQSLAHRVISNCTLDQQGSSTVLLPVTRVGRDPEVSGSQHAPYLLYLKVHCR